MLSVVFRGGGYVPIVLCLYYTNFTCIFDALCALRNTIGCSVNLQVLTADNIAGVFLANFFQQLFLGGPSKKQLVIENE